MEIRKNQFSEKSSDGLCKNGDKTRNDVKKIEFLPNVQCSFLGFLGMHQGINWI